MIYILAVDDSTIFCVYYITELEFISPKVWLYIVGRLLATTTWYIYKVAKMNMFKDLLMCRQTDRARGCC